MVNSCDYQYLEEKAFDFMHEWSDGSGCKEIFKEVQFEQGFKGWVGSTSWKKWVKCK